MKIEVTEALLDTIPMDDINSFSLRSAMESWDIVNCFLKPKGYVGNRPVQHDPFMYDDAPHEDDTWAIDLYDPYGELVIDSYLYTSRAEYEEDLSLIKSML